MASHHPITSLPGLPQPDDAMNWRHLNAFRDGERGAEFYLTCLKYAQHLWLQQLPARAILCLDRAWCAELVGDEPVLTEWPLPYGPLVDIVISPPNGAFLGNPRIHFQHYADRLGAPRRDQRKWRSWACWALARRARPDLPGDPRHDVEEPTLDEISDQLDRLGIEGERALWQFTLDVIR